MRHSRALIQLERNPEYAGMFGTKLRISRKAAPTNNFGKYVLMWVRWPSNVISP
ncbi:MAG: hypothetical protein ACRDJ4_11910 [Actinomycetota bacterium]